MHENHIVHIMPQRTHPDGKDGNIIELSVAVFIYIQDMLRRVQQLHRQRMDQRIRKSRPAKAHNAYMRLRHMQGQQNAIQMRGGILWPGDKRQEHLHPLPVFGYFGGRCTKSHTML